MVVVGMLMVANFLDTYPLLRVCRGGYIARVARPHPITSSLGVISRHLKINELTMNKLGGVPSQKDTTARFRAT